MLLSLLVGPNLRKKIGVSFLCFFSSLYQVEFQDEEMQVKEVEREVITEISMPQVKTLYKYKGQGMGFDKGEVQ